MARRSHLERRLVAILDSSVNRNSPSRVWASLAVLVTVAMIAPLAAIRAQTSQSPTAPIDLDALIRAANAQRNPEILENAAREAEESRKYDTAQILLQSAAAIRAEISGEGSVEYGRGLLKIGELEQRRQDQPSAGYFYGQAAQVLGDRPEAAPALIHLGTAAFVKGDTAQALDYLQHSQRVDPVHAGSR